MADGYNNGSRPDDTRRTLYERFKAIIGRRDGADYFDEDDIIDIFDYANDYNDDFTKIEALFYGARMFPDSEALKIRRDYLYYYLGYDDAVKVMLDRCEKPSPLSTLLSMHQKADAGTDTTDELEALLGSLDHKMDDEETIRFIDIAGANTLNYAWLKANVDRIARLAEYPVTLLYEVVGAAEEMSDYDTALKYADELTMLEPFNIEFWQLLASLNLNAGKYEAAVSAADYALALDPADTKSRRIKALALHQSGGASETVIGLLRSIMAEEEFDSACVRTLAELLVRSDRIDEANDILRRYNRANPDDRNVVEYLLVTDPQYATTIMPTHAVATDDDDEAYWKSWAMQLASRGEHDAAFVVLREAMRRQTLHDLRLVYEELYLGGRYQAVVDIYERHRENGPGGNEDNVAYIMSLIRLGRTDEAAKAADEALRNVRPLDVSDESMPSRLPYVFYVQGIMSTLVNIRMALAAPDKLPVDDFDPFRYLTSKPD